MEKSVWRRDRIVALTIGMLSVLMAGVFLLARPSPNLPSRDAGKNDLRRESGGGDSMGRRQDESLSKPAEVESEAVCASEAPDDSLVECARRALRALMAIPASEFFYHEVVEQHLDTVLEAMLFLQKHPREGFTFVRELYEETDSPRHKGLLVFIASAARESDEALEFFRQILGDLNLDSSVRLACVFALQMANMPIDGPGKELMWIREAKEEGTWGISPEEAWGIEVPKPVHNVKWHFATVLWAIGNHLARPPAAVYSFNASSLRRWPCEGPYGWQDVESSTRILQLFIDALQTENCPRIRYVLVGALGWLEDEQRRADIYRHAYETDGWTIPEGYLGEGAAPVRSLVIQRFAKWAAKTRKDIWFNAFRWVTERHAPWESGYEFVVDGWKRLGWIDRAFIERSVTPLLRPEIYTTKFPVGSYWVVPLLQAAPKHLTGEETGQMCLELARIGTAYAEKQVQLGKPLARACLEASAGLATEEEVCRILLGHPCSDVRRITADTIRRRGMTALVPDLTARYHVEEEENVYKAIREALAVLAPDILAMLEPRTFPTWNEILAEKLRRGLITQEQYDFHKDDADEEED